MDKINFKALFGDIRFWIVLSFIIRLFGITDAPLEGGHNWRQSLTAMMGRNFLETGPNLFFPTIDMDGINTGVIASEFPFFSYLIYVFSYLFGYAHWYGRLINLTVSCIGIFHFYKLVQGTIDKKTAFNSTLVFLVSLWFAHSRKIMPDTFSVSLVITGLYYGFAYLRDGLKWQLFLFFSICTLGMLCKIPALSLFSVVAIVIFLKSVPLSRRLALNTAAGVGVFVVYLWYYKWVPYVVETYKFQLFFPKTFTEGLQEIAPLIPELLEKFYFSALCSFVAFACFIIGLVFLFKNKGLMLHLALTIISIVFAVFIIKTGSVFPTHTYYVIPFVPIMALAAGYLITQVPSKYQYILLGIIAIESIANQQHDFFIKDNQLYKLTLESKLDKTVPKKDLIIINGGESPQNIYFANRKGWTVEPGSISNLDYVDSLANVGAQYLIVDQHYFNFKTAKYPLVFGDNDFSIYKLK